MLLFICSPDARKAKNIHVIPGPARKRVIPSLLDYSADDFDDDGNAINILGQLNRFRRRFSEVYLQAVSIADFGDTDSIDHCQRSKSGESL